MTDSDNDSGGGENNGNSDKEENRLLLLANVSRIMKRALPANAKIPKEAKELMQECASEFIGFITSEASDKCLREKHKTINGDDLLWAMSALGFDNYIDPLKLYLHKFRELEGCLTGAPGDSGSASSSQPTDVLGGGGNDGGRYGAGLYGTSTGGAGSSGSGMKVMDQQLYSGAPSGGGSASPSISSQPTDVLGGGGNVGGSYGAGLYGIGTGGVGSDGSGMMVMGQELYGGSPTSGSLYQHQPHQLGGSGLFPGNSGSGSGGGSGGSSSPSGRRKDMI